jgi:uncharacterized protein
MDDMTCPQCQETMRTSHLGDASVARCGACGGVFLSRVDAGSLGELENDWHLASGPRTAPLPRITADMDAPPPSRPRARSFIESLFT